MASAARISSLRSRTGTGSPSASTSWLKKGISPRRSKNPIETPSGASSYAARIRPRCIDAHLRLPARPSIRKLPSFTSRSLKATRSPVRPSEQLVPTLGQPPLHGQAKRASHSSSGGAPTKGGVLADEGIEGVRLPSRDLRNKIGRAHV